MSTVELSAPPRLGPMYRSAMLSSVRGRPTGDTLPDVELVLPEVTVDRRHLAAYDRACGFRLTDELPGTYPHVLAFPLAMALMTRPDFPLPLIGMVHVANSVSLARPIRADETLELRVRVEGLRPHDRGSQVDVVARGLVGAELVWSSRSTYLHRQRATRPDPRPAPERAAPPDPTAVWRLDRRVGERYAAASGDLNPIHTSRLGARLFGFPRPIAHGMWSKARCLATMEGRLPTAYTVDVYFKLPILLPSTVAFSAQPDAPGSWRLALNDTRSGRPHLTGVVAPV